jgi:hypothetical protein
VNRLAMRANRGDLPRLQIGFPYHCQRGIRETFTQQKIQLTNFGNRTMETNAQDLSSQGWRKSLMQMRQHSRPEFSRGLSDFRHDGVDTVGGSSRHETDDQFRTVFTLFKRHQRRLDEALTSDKVVRSNIGLLSCQTCVVLWRRQPVALMPASAKRIIHYENLVTKGQALQEKEQMSAPLSKEEVNDFEKQREAVFNNPVARNFLDAQEELHNVQATIQQYVNKTLELGRMPTEEDMSGGGCGHGCGCHH